MINWLYNKLYKHKTKDFTQIPLFIMVFNAKKWKEDKNSKSCHVYRHPDIETDDFINFHCQAIADYVRANYDMERFTKI